MSNAHATECVNDPFDEIVSDPDPLKRPQAIRIDSHPGMSHKARKIEECGRVAVMLRDKAGHHWSRVFHCNQRFCPNCAITRRARMLKQLLKVVPNALRENSRIHVFGFVRVFVDLPHDLTKADLHTFKDRITQGIDALTSVASACQIYSWPEKQGFEARIIVLGEYDISVLVAAFKGLTTRTVTLPIRKLSECLCEFISADLPSTPEARADAEHIADGVRLFRTTGAFFGQHQAPAISEPELGRTELFTEDDAPTVNKSPHIRFSLCPCCGERAIEISETYSPADSPPDPTTLEWRRLD